MGIELAFTVPGWNMDLNGLPSTVPCRLVGTFRTVPWNVPQARNVPKWNDRSRMERSQVLQRTIWSLALELQRSAFLLALP